MEALTSAQKAAIIISSIGTENASEVFKHFSDEEVEQITLEIARMNYYPMEVVDSVLNEFYELCLTQKVISEGGVGMPVTYLKRHSVRRRRRRCLKR